MEGVLTAQQALVPVLENTAAAIDATRDETWTVGLVTSRLELLDRYWCMFEENHVALFQAKTPQETPYFAQGTYSRLESVYIEARGRLFDAEARLRPEASHTQGLAPLANSSQLLFQQPRSSARLPRITVPEFSGRREDWESFRDLFMDARRMKVCATTSTVTASCAAYQGSHQASRCPHFRQLSIKERKGMVSRFRLCYNCLGRSHVAISCPSQSMCRICGKLHIPCSTTSAVDLR